MRVLAHLFFVLAPVAKGKERAAVVSKERRQCSGALNAIISDVELPLYSDELYAHPGNTVT